MTVGSPLEAVAQAIREHRFVEVASADACTGCDWRGHGDQHDDHAAEVVVAALELREETAFKYTHNASGRHTIIESDSSDVRIARKIAGDTHTLAPVRRWVSSWTSVSDER